MVTSWMWVIRFKLWPLYLPIPVGYEASSAPDRVRTRWREEPLCPWKSNPGFSVRSQCDLTIPAHYPSVWDIKIYPLVVSYMSVLNWWYGLLCMSYHCHCIKPQHKACRMMQTNPPGKFVRQCDIQSHDFRSCLKVMGIRYSDTIK